MQRGLSPRTIGKARRDSQESRFAGFGGGINEIVDSGQDVLRFAGATRSMTSTKQRFAFGGVSWTKNEMVHCTPAMR